ncbi:MAG TPA: hypothetical protein VK694_05730 [Verrucomicrobiae bacterium]|nr:hypothetical protein [Verrucomicrobiae bacterium]
MGEGYFFEPFTIESIGRDIDCLKFSANGLINVQLRQAVNMPDPERDIRIELNTAHPALSLIIEHEDRYWHSTRKSSWIVSRDGSIEHAMLDFATVEHGPVTDRTKRNHLSFVLGDFTVAKTIPPPVY